MQCSTCVHHSACLFLLLTSVSWMMGAARPVQERHILKNSKVNNRSSSGGTGYSNCQDLTTGEPKALYFQELTDAKRSTLLTVLSARAVWISQMEEVVQLANWQERSAFHQPRAWEKSPCRNFFWKTFSSC